MTVRVVRTLAAMGGVYRLSAAGGPASSRFQRYVELGRAGLPVSAYNPMTNQDVLGTIDDLLASDAETVIEDAANDQAQVLRFTDDLDMYIAVATPGMWTERTATEVEHRLLGRASSQVLLWNGESVSTTSTIAETIAQLVRVVWIKHHGPPATVADAVGCEGLAAALGQLDTKQRGPDDRAVADALDILGEDTALGTMVAVVYGDDAARTLGFTPIGLTEKAGLRYSAALAAEELRRTSAATLITERWSPARPSAAEQP